MKSWYIRDLLRLNDRPSNLLSKIFNIILKMKNGLLNRIFEHENSDQYVISFV